MPSYRTTDSNGRWYESELLRDVKAVAEQRLMGLHCDDYVMIEEYQAEGFWEPSHRVERDSRNRVVCR